MMRIPGLVLLATLAAAEAPVVAQDAAPVSPRGRTSASFVVGPEDLIEVFVWKEPELSATVTVRPDGMITLPLAGEMYAAGSTPQELGEEITKRLKQYIDQPIVTVVVKEIHSSKISVLGEVRRPGRYLLLQNANVLDAIAMGGGFTEFASRKGVVVLRKTPSGTERYRIDVKRLVEDPGTRPFLLYPQDVVYVN